MKIAGVTILGPWITADTNLYIATTGDDSTGDGSSGAPWATINKALSYLGGYRIANGVYVTINVAAGHYSFASSVNIRHVDGTQIRIVGATPVSKTMSSVQSSSGGAGNYSIIVNLDSVSDIAVGDYAIFRTCAGGTRPQCMFGVWEITNVDAVNTRITVTSTQQVNVPSGNVTAAVTVLTSVLTFTGVNGITVTDGCSIGNRWEDKGIAYLMIVGDLTAGTFGISTLNSSSIFLENVIGVSNFPINVMATINSTVTVLKANILNSGKSSIGGLYAGSASVINAAGVLSCGSVGYGANAYLSGVCTIGDCVLCGNGIGQQAVQEGVINAMGTVAYNTIGAYARGMSYNYYAATDKTGNTTDATPTADAAPASGYDYSFIDTAI